MTSQPAFHTLLHRALACMLLYALGAACCLLIGASVPAAAAHATATAPATEPAVAARIRGVVVSCQTWGREWGTDAMSETLRELRALGVNWVQIHPYLGIGRDGQVSTRHLPEDPDAPAPEWLARPIREARALGLKIVIAPHVAGWRAGWPWRGDITFTTEGDWTRFFTSYRAAIVRLARLCREADAFVVGSELDRTLDGREREWRGIVAAVRAETRAALTYGANWSDYTRVPFWDALDAIGVSAYFPLVAHDRPPTDAELDAAWSRIARELAAYSAERAGKPVVFLELGYDESLTAARQPWVDGLREPGARDVQARCLDRALAALERPDFPVLGAFLWKWFPGDHAGENYSLQDPHLRAVLRRRWLPPLAL